MPSQAIKTSATAEGGTKKRQIYKKIPTRFVLDGFELVQVHRVGNRAIYEQRKKDRLIAFEVILIRKHKGFEVGGRLVEPAEYYPRSEDWGTYGWTLPNFETAKAKMQNIK